jgi:hypothetical protein
MEDRNENNQKKEKKEKEKDINSRDKLVLISKFKLHRNLL